MTDEKWENLISSVKENFKIIEEKIEDILKKNPITEEEQHWGWIHSLVFLHPKEGEMKLERIKQKLIKEEKLYYHRRKSDAKVEYVLSDSEFIDKVKLYKRKNSEWEELNLEELV